MEISDLGCQANSAVLGKYGETAVLVTVVMGKKDEPKNYLPLVVDYEEKFYAAGKLSAAVLSDAKADLQMKPLFPVV